MKTTVEISDGILDEARKVAAREGTTVRALIEAGLRKEVQHRRGAGRFRLKRASFKGRGLRPGELWTADRDFSRFPDLKVRNPLVDSKP